MTLARADLLWMGPLMGILVALAVHAHARRLRRLRADLGQAAARRLVPVGPARVGARLACALLAAAAIGLAAAGPTASEPEPAPPPAPLDLAIAVDLSLSMTAADVAPSRLSRAREVVVEVSEALPSARIALVVFADWPYALVPLTDDLEVVRWFARALVAEAVLERHQGTSLASALTRARGALGERPRQGSRQAILVLSDGGAHDVRDAVLQAAREAAGSGVGVWTGGLGTARGVGLGSPASPMLDGQGAAVVAALDDDLLRALASAGGGRYEDVTGAEGVRSLVSGLAAAQPTSARGELRGLSATAWLVLFALPLLLWEGALDAGRGLGRSVPAHRRSDA